MIPLYEFIGAPAMYEQLAEECTELAHASLKMARALRNENPVHGESALKGSRFENLVEEIADVLICLEQVEHMNGGYDIQSQIASIVDEKDKRMLNRLIEDEVKKRAKKPSPDNIPCTFAEDELPLDNVDSTVNALKFHRI